MFKRATLTDCNNPTRTHPDPFERDTLRSEYAACEALAQRSADDAIDHTSKGDALTLVPLGWDYV